jgi:hypothetical protein
MNIKQHHRFIKLFSLFLILGTCFVGVQVYAHGGGLKIIPKQLSVQAGSVLTVEVQGLKETKTASFKLVGMFGEQELGTYSIKSEDFTQALTIPKKVKSGSYRLIVEGGGESAKIVISVK